MHSPTELSTEQTPQTLFTIVFHQNEGVKDGQFIDIPSKMVPTILNQLPKNWIAVLYLQPKNEPVTTHSH
jgi:hypothetical protein